MLRPVHDADIDIFYGHQCDPEACAMAAFPPRTVDGHYSHWTKLRSDDTVLTRTIEFEGDVVGHIVSYGSDGEREISYWIGKPYWGRGLATAALELMLAQEPHRPLFARVAEHNVGSARVLTKCGFGVVSKEAADDGITEVIYRLDH